MKCERANFEPKMTTCVLCKKNMTGIRMVQYSDRAHSFFSAQPTNHICDIKFTGSDVIQHCTYVFLDFIKT